MKRIKMFTYGSCVKITGGFYAGQVGRVVVVKEGPAHQRKQLTYTVLLSDGHSAEHVPEPYLEKAAPPGYMTAISQLSTGF